jgi:hypothetical protein
MPTQPERIASLETTAAIAKGVLGVFIPLVILWGSYITVNVIAIKQQMADGGNTKLVTELKTPKSPEQLRANLSTVVAQVQSAQANGIKPNPQKVYALSGAVSEAAQKNPELPQAWQAASELVNFRSGTQPIPPDPCFESEPHFDNERPDGPLMVTIQESNCTGDLGDADAFSRQIGNYMGEQQKELGSRLTAVNLVFLNAHIIYRGGPIFNGIK